MVKHTLLTMTLALTLLVSAFYGSASPAAADDSRTFPETGKTVSGEFLQYWNDHGGLTQQGFPISNEMQEKSDTDGKTYTVQYFERAVFEAHPENQAPNNVLLSLLGTFLYSQKYPSGAPGQQTSTENPRLFAETGKTIGGRFRTYWETHGGLAQQGYPISEEFQEKSDLDGKTYTVQYFQRAVFEYHPEYAGTSSEVLLSQLGKFRYDAKYNAAQPTQPAKSSVTVPGWTSVALTNSDIAFFYNATTGAGVSARINSDGSYTTLEKYPDAAKGNPALVTGWTHVVSLPNNLLLFYDQNGGAALIGRLGTDGVYKDLAPVVLSAGFSEISVDANGIGLLHNNTKGGWWIVRFTGDGSYQLLQNNPNAQANWAAFAPLSNGFWFFYVKFNGNGAIQRIAPDGTISNVNSYTTIDRVWTNVVGSINGTVLFYDKASGSGGLGQVGNDGAYKYLVAYPGTPGVGGTFGEGWTSVLASADGTVLLYNSDNGRMTIGAIGSNLQYKNTKAYITGQ